MPGQAFGCGLGFRRGLLPALKENVPGCIDFFELAPENWLPLGGRHQRDLRLFTERYPFVCHGLSLSLGGPAPLDTQLVGRIRRFMDEHDISLYTEHLSWCSDDGHLYDLLPIPLTEGAVTWVAERIRQTQDILGQQIAIENASYYLTPPGADMSETDFITAVIQASDCLLHLDVNNVYVNSQNFGFDPLTFIESLPLSRLCYLHVAGHYREPDGLLVDTHGTAVIDPVWQLLEATYDRLGTQAHRLPTCLERDFNLPPLAELVRELNMIQQLQSPATPEKTSPYHDRP